MNTSDFSAPITDRYFEDYHPGFIAEYGSITVDEQEMIEFARRFDPQEFHTDPVRAAQGFFGGLIASGWHTCSLMMRLIADHYFPRSQAWALQGSTNCAGCGR